MSTTSGTSIEKKIAGIILIALFVGCLIVFLPFLSATIWAIVLCVASWPLYTRLVRWFEGRRTLAAFLLSVAMVLVVLLPFVVVGLSLGDTVRNVTASIKERAASGPLEPPTWLAKVPVVGAKATERWQELAADRSQVRSRAAQLIEKASPHLVSAGLAVGGGLIQLALSIFVAFFLLRDGDAFADRLKSAVDRIAGERGRHLLVVAGNTLRGVVYGILGTALVQGIATGIGLLIAGVPNVALLALLAFFASVVPVVGPALVWLPCALWLFAHGDTPWGFFLLIYGIAVNNIDNFLKPYLISKGSDMPFVLIFFGVLGGAVAFGFIGVFLGPALLAVGYRIIEEWNATRPASPASGEPTGKTL